MPARRRAQSQLGPVPLLVVYGGFRSVLQHRQKFYLLGPCEVNGGNESLLVVFNADAQGLVALPNVFGANVLPITFQGLLLGGRER